MKISKFSMKISKFRIVKQPNGLYRLDRRIYFLWFIPTPFWNKELRDISDYYGTNYEHLTYNTLEEAEAGIHDFYKPSPPKTKEITIKKYY